MDLSDHKENSEELFAWQEANREAEQLKMS